MDIYKPLDNKYYHWYLSIMKKAQQRQWTKKNSPCYVENHHIIPKSLGGKKEKSNLVCLTAKEHYIVHKLLVCCYEGQAKWKMIKAFNSMFWISSDHGIKFFRAKDYMVIKQTISEWMKGPFNPKYVDGRSQNPKIKKKSGLRRGGIYKKIKFTSPLGDISFSDNIKTFCKVNNLNQGNISSVASGRLLSHKGWRAEYI